MHAVKRSFAEESLGLTTGAFPFESHFISAEGARVHYIDEGTGPVLLMMHGNPTWSFVFRHLVTLLRDRFRCIVPDLPGFGLSSAPVGYAFRPEDHARMMGAFVDALALESYTPVVQDWGGPIAIAVAGRDPGRIERLIVGNTFAWPVNGDVHFELFSRVMGGPAGKFAIRRYNAFVNLLIPAGIKRSRVSEATMHAYRQALPTPDRRTPTFVLPRSILESRAFLSEAQSALGRLKSKPALILWGDADFAFRPKEREHFESVLTNHRTVLLHGAGHYIWEDAPDEIAQAIGAWWQ